MGDGYHCVGSIIANEVNHGMRRPGGLIPHLVVNGGPKAIEFYKKCGAVEKWSRMPEQGGGPRLMHAELRIGDATLMLCDDFPEYCGGVSRAPKPLRSDLDHVASRRSELRTREGPACRSGGARGRSEGGGEPRGLPT